MPLRALWRSLGGPLRAAGEGLESLGHSIAGTSARAAEANSGTSHAAAALATVGETSFVAPSALLNAPVQLGDRASIWYNVVIEADCVVGANSSLRDHVQVRGGKTSVGDGVVVGASAVLEGCSLLDHCAVGEGATVGAGATIEAGAAVAPGSVVPSNVTVKAGELWSGSPAAFARALTGEEAASMAESCEKHAVMATMHKHECAKDPFQVDDERQAFKDRDLYYETIREDADSEWETFMAQPGPQAHDLANADRRGLVYDK